MIYSLTPALSSKRWNPHLHGFLELQLHSFHIWKNSFHICPCFGPKLYSSSVVSSSMHSCQSQSNEKRSNFGLNTWVFVCRLLWANLFWCLTCFRASVRMCIHVNVCICLQIVLDQLVLVQLVLVFARHVSVSHLEEQRHDVDSSPGQLSNLALACHNLYNLSYNNCNPV